MQVKAFRYVVLATAMTMMAACQTPPPAPTTPADAAPAASAAPVPMVDANAGDTVESAISVIRALERPGRDNVATVWDGNKYIQCRRMTDHTLRCEAAGVLMQPSLQRVLTPQRVAQLTGMGWNLDPSFGNYAQIFKADVPPRMIADKIRKALQIYGANIGGLEVSTKSIRSEPCPPRNGYAQNLAGIINDAPSMKAYSIHACVYKPRAEESVRLLAYGSTAADLIGVYGPRLTAEIQRLRINIQRRVYVIFDTDIGYIQCETEAQPEGFYCEAQSTDSWPALAAVLTPDRVERLHKAGYADPGRAPNYSKTYAAGKITDAALAAEILTLLHDVYGYYGASKLAIKTDEG